MKSRRLAFGLLCAFAMAPMWAQGPQLTVAFTGPPRLFQEIERAFESYRGDILRVDRKITDLAGDPSSPPAADVVWGGGELLHRAMGELGWLHQYRSSQLGAVGQEYRLGGSPSMGAGIEQLVIVYNTDLVVDPPRVWADLLAAGGRIAIADAGQSPESLLATAVLARKLEWSFLETLARTRPLLAPDLSTVAELVAEGRAPLGITSNVEVLQAAAAGAPVAIAWPQDGAVPILRPIAIIARPERSAFLTGMAEQLVDFVLSAEGQRIASRYGFVPVRADVPGPGGTPAAGAMPVAGAGWATDREADVRDTFSLIFKP